MKWYQKTYVWNFLDILFPPRCAGCEKWGGLICNDCLKKIIIISEPVCIRCGHPVQSYRIKCCDRCRSSVIYYDNIRSWAYFEGVLKKAIHRLKYCRDLGLSERLSIPMILLLREQKWKVDKIIPVPLDPERFRYRGYNQAALLAKPISRNTGIAFDGDSLVRIHKTRSQVGLSEIERKENVNNVFKANFSSIKGRSVLLIDDVITTGSTLNSCAKTLKKAEASRVYGLSPARSLRL